MSVTDHSIQPAQSKRSVFFTAILVVGVLVFMGSIFGVALALLAIEKHSQTTVSDINLASRQRMLTQQIDKDLLQIQALRRGKHPRPVSADLADMAQAVNLWDATTMAFKKGGKTEDASGKTIYVDALKASQQRALVNTADLAWQPVKHKLQAVSNPPRAFEVAQSIQTAFDATPQLLDAMNNLVLSLEQDSSQEVAALTQRRNMLLLLAMAALVLMIGTLFQRLSDGQKQVEAYAADLESRNVDLASRTRELAEAKAGTDLIMDTVRQGLLLIDNKFLIQSQYSRELESIFRLPELAGYNFLNILQRLLTERMFNTSKDYLALLFDPTKKERTVLKVNPVDEVEVNFPNPDGGFISKYLNFSFRRIIENGKITRVFIAVSDITERVQLERQLRDSEAKKEKQFELLLSILHVEPRMLDDFVATAQEQVRAMNDALRAQDFASANTGQMELLRKRLDTVFRCVHNIKGNAGLLKLEYFQKTTEAFESKIVELKNRPALGGDDFLSVVIAQSELRTDLEELQDLRQKFMGMQALAAPLAQAAPPRPAPVPAAAPPSAPAPSYVAAPFTVTTPAATNGTPSDELAASIAQLAQTIAQKLGKEVRVEAPGFDSHSLGDERRRIVKDILIQLTRNSMTHGVEEPEKRIAAGKPRAATITIRPLADAPANAFAFSFRDDGRGLDPAGIRARAVAQGLVTAEEAAQYDDSEVAGFIFAPGFTTAEEATPDAGRGMGMDIVKQHVVDECGGEISVSADPGRYCEFSFILPAADLVAR